MKKLISAALATVVAVAALAACGDESSSSEAKKKTKDESSSAAQVEENSSQSDETPAQAEDDSSQQQQDEEEISKEVIESYVKQAFTAASAYCADKEANAEMVTFDAYEFDPTQPDPAQEFEVYVSQQLGKNYKGQLSFELENGVLKKASFINDKKEVVAAYPVG